MRNVSFIADDAVLNLEFCRRGARVNRLVGQLHEFIKIERTIVECARQTKPVIYQYSFTRPVAFVHPTDLRDRGVRFVDDGEKIIRKKIDNRVRPRAGRPPGQMARIIFNPVAETHFLQHFQIVFGAHSQPLRFKQFVL